MLSTEIHEAAVEFGRALQHAPAVTAYREAKTALDADSDALALMDELRRLQGTFVEVQQRGKTPSPELNHALRRCQADVRASAVIMAHLRTTNEVKAFLPMAAAEVTRSLGADYARSIAPASC